MQEDYIGGAFVAWLLLQKSIFLQELSMRRKGRYMLSVTTKCQPVNSFVSDLSTPRCNTSSLRSPPVNLTDIYEITSRTSEYPSLPKLGESLSAQRFIDHNAYHIFPSRPVQWRYTT